MYDYMLGGKDNFESDREEVDQLLLTAPEVGPGARRNRAALARAARWAVLNGIRQVIDIGSGLPWTNTDDPEMRALHQQIEDLPISGPPAQVVYVDNDPIVLAHGRALAKGAIVVDADLHDEELLDQPELQASIDLKEPVALVLGAILHFVPDDDYAAALVQRLAARLAPGSVVIISHATADELTQDRVDKAHSIYEKSSAELVFRSHDGIKALFGNLELEESGVTRLDEWHPEYAPTDNPANDPRGSTWLQIGVAYVPKPGEPEIESRVDHTSAPSVARVVAAYQGHRPELTTGEQALIADVHAVAPEAALLARQNQAFTVRAIRDLAELGVRQYIDLGCGIPSEGDDVHQIARRANPEADVRAVYIDNDPDVIARRRDTIRDTPGAAAVAADVRDVNTILAHQDVRQLIDFDEPVALIASLVLHCIRDKDDPAAIIAGFRREMVRGSYLILSHITGGEYPEPARAGALAYTRHGANKPMILRPPADIRAYFDGFDLLPPGLVKPVDWRPDETPPYADLTAPDWVLAGVGIY